MGYGDALEDTVGQEFRARCQHAQSSVRTPRTGVTSSGSDFRHISQPTSEARPRRGEPHGDRQTDRVRPTAMPFAHSPSTVLAGAPERRSAAQAIRRRSPDDTRGQTPKPPCQRPLAQVTVRVDATVETATRSRSDVAAQLRRRDR